jgi:hypothetical protein
VLDSRRDDLAKDPDHILGQGIRCDIEIPDLAPEEYIPHSAPNQVALKPGFGEKRGKIFYNPRDSKHRLRYSCKW